MKNDFFRKSDAVFLLLALAIFLTNGRPLYAQDNTRQIIRRLTIVKYPLLLTFKINDQPLKGKEVAFPELGVRSLQFEAGADWLQNLTLSLENVSEKTITYVVLNLTFAQTATPDKPRVSLHQIILGIDPDRKFVRAALRLAPKKSVEIRLEPEYPAIRTLVRDRIPPEQIRQVEVEIHAALFDDGTLFEAGVLHRRDPNDPKRWAPIKP